MDTINELYLFVQRTPRIITCFMGEVELGPEMIHSFCNPVRLQTWHLLALVPPTKIHEREQMRGYIANRV